MKRTRLAKFLENCFDDSSSFLVFDDLGVAGRLELEMGVGSGGGQFAHFDAKFEAWAPQLEVISAQPRRRID